MTNISAIDVVDLDDNEFSYSLISGTGGEDNALFNVASGTLRTNGGFNYEVDSILSIKIRIADPHGAVYQKVFSIKVEDANDSPTGISLSGDKIGENATVGTKVADVSTEDEDAGDSFTYTLVDDAGGAFVIIGSELRTNQIYDRSVQSEFTIKIRTEDESAASFEQEFIIGITESNNAPTNVQLSNNSIAENGSTDELVGELSTVDSDPEDTNFTYELVSGTGSDNNNDFSIDNSTSPPVLKAKQVFDFEANNLLRIRIKTTDPKGANFVKQLEIHITDANDAPTAISLLADSIAENQPVNTVIGLISTADVDAGDSFTYSLVSGDGDVDNSSFSIESNTGELKQAVENYDFETKKTYSIRVESTDSGGETVQDILIVNILDLNEAPSQLNLSNNTVIEEDASAIVGIIDVTDPDIEDTYTLNLPDSLDNAYFELAAGGQLGLSKALNFEAANLPNPLKVVITAIDNGGLSISKDFSINVLDIDDPIDSIKIAGNPIFSGEIMTDVIVGVINIYDDELNNISDYDRTKYITNKFDNIGDDLTDDTKFNIVYNSSIGTFGQYQIKAIQKIDFDESLDNIYDFTISVANGGVTVEKQVVFEIKNPSENIRPSALHISDTVISENTLQTRTVGILTTDDPNINDDYSYSLITGELDNSLFEITENELQVKASTELNFLQKDTYQVSITAIETNTEEAYSISNSFKIKIEEYVDNEPPVIDASSQSSNIISDGSKVSLGLKINDWKLDKIEFQKASILSTSFEAPEIAIYDPSSASLDITISEEDFDAFGMKLKILATDAAGNQSESDIFYVYRSLLADNIYSELPAIHLGKGRLTTDYRMLSIPYSVNDQGIKVFLERQLGVELGPETFQVFRYNTSSQSYINGVSLNNFRAGEAYWFTTVVENPIINFGAGELFPYKAEFGDDSVFVFQLKQGWNQLGNPYPVDINWSSLIQGTNIGQLQVYGEDGYTTSNTLPVHGGGFVLVQEDVNLPVIINNTNVQRISDSDAFDWKVDFTVNQDNLKNSGRLGMHKEAKTTLDAFDIANPPHFTEHLEINFDQVDRFYTNYKSDVVNPLKQYSWTFQINSHKKGSPIELSWTSEGIVPKQLYLIDLETLNKVDMALLNSYRSNSGGAQGFRVIYSLSGEDFNLGELLVGKPIPNPMGSNTSIGLNLPQSVDAYTVSAEIIDLQGRLIKVLKNNQQMVHGYHTIDWDGINTQGGSASTGLYMYRIKIIGEQSGTYTGRILKKNN